MISLFIIKIEKFLLVLMIALLVVPLNANNNLIEEDNGDNYTFLIQAGYRPKVHLLAKYIVSIRFGRPKKFFGDNHICSGSILTPTAILTAAHCVTYKKSAKVFPVGALKIVAGTAFLFKATTEMREESVDEIIVHPHWSHSTFVADIAIIHLKNKFELNEKSRSMVTLIDRNPKPGTVCTVFGWGRIFDQGPKTAELTYANLTVIEKKKCRSPFGVICLRGSLDNEMGTGRGDSGGPLMCEDMLAGIVSHGTVPESLRKDRFIFSSFFTNVYEYRDWINENKAVQLELSLFWTSSLFSFLFALCKIN